MSSEVTAILEFLSSDYRFIKSLKSALGPDNVAELPPNMRVQESLRNTGKGDYSYVVEITVRGDALQALRRASSTVDEILAICKALCKSREVATRK